MANLITSSSEYDIGALGSLDKEWVEEYLDGYGQEVYIVPVPKEFIGKLFCVASNICFNEFRVCMFGIESPVSDGTVHGGSRVCFSHQAHPKLLQMPRVARQMLMALPPLLSPTATQATRRG